VTTAFVFAEKSPIYLDENESAEVTPRLGRILLRVFVGHWRAFSKAQDVIRPFCIFGARGVKPLEFCSQNFLTYPVCALVADRSALSRQEAWASYSAHPSSPWCCFILGLRHALLRECFAAKNEIHMMVIKPK